MTNQQTAASHKRDGMQPIHPGEILREEYLVPLNLSANALARSLLVPPSRINDIVLGRRGITADTALRLARYFGGDALTWLNLQTQYDLRCAQTDFEGLAKIDLVQPYGPINISAGTYRFCW